VKQVQVCGSRIALAVRLEMVEGGERSTEIVIVDWQGNKTKSVSEAISICKKKLVADVQILSVVCRRPFVSVCQRITDFGRFTIQ
jgi:hypothetical protein